MSVATFGSWRGDTTAGADMIPILKAKEEARTTRKNPMSNGFSILQLAVNAPEGTVLYLNGEQVVIPKTGVFQIGYGLVDIEKLVFESVVTVSVLYLY